MTSELEIGLYIFMLAGFLGYHVISRVPPLLHTPLMSATNAIAGISLVGSLVVAGADYGPLSTVLGFIAVTCSSTNVVGGFLITDRMLKMFKKTEDQTAQVRRFQFDPKILVTLAVLVVGLLVLAYSYEELNKDAVHFFRDVLPAHALKYFYILSAALFILGLKGLSSPKYARRGMFLAEFGMFMAVVGTLFHHEIVKHGVLIIGPLNLPSTVPFHASEMYARTVTNYLMQLIKDGRPHLDLEDELTRGPLVTHQGEILHEAVKARL